MNIKKHNLRSVILIAVLFALPIQAAAQWNLGLSYQTRDAYPDNGLGIHLQRNILRGLPLINIGIRGHFAYFSSEFLNEKNENLSGSFTTYDFGAAAVVGVSLKIVEPYVGLGIVSSRVNGENVSESDFLWNAFLGVKLTIIPGVHPFGEYRFDTADEAGDAINDVELSSPSRISIGVEFDL